MTPSLIPRNSDIQKAAILEIYKTFGDSVSFETKAKRLYKFGRNSAVGTSLVTVSNTGSNETYLTTNGIDKISSSNAGDTEVITIEGHTIAAGLLTFVVQSVTLVGQTETALTTPLRDVTRAYNAGTTDLLGTVYIYEDDTVTAGVPDTAANIHMQIAEGNQSEKCATSLDSDTYMIITSFTGYCFKKTGSPMIEFTGEVREVSASSKVFRRVFTAQCSNNSPSHIEFSPPLIVPKNFDIRVRAKADSASTDVGASFNGYLAEITALYN
jgi:hypothetical protein